MQQGHRKKPEQRSGGVYSNDSLWVPSPDAAAQALQALYRRLNSHQEIERYLYELCSHAVELVPDADMAGVTVVDDHDTASTLARTTPAVEAVNEVQYRFSSGPALDAAHRGMIVTADHSAVQRRWPELSEVGLAHGVASFLSLPLPPLRRGLRSGSLNLYAHRMDGFQDTQVALMNVFATAAGHAIKSIARYRDAREDAFEFERALNSRAAIDQAKGILMAVHRVDADTAFHMLVRTSQLTNTKLRVVAEELLASIYSGSAQVSE